MKKLVKTILFCSTLLGLISILSFCKKGDTGPKGDPGPQGPAGAAGTNGTASIKTVTFTTNSSQWIADNSSKVYYYNYTSSEITSSVLSSGVVIAYLGDGSGSLWIAMPLTAQGVEITYGIKPSTVEIDVSLSSGLMPNNPGGLQFKIVIIPAAAAKTGVNYNNYTEVKATYNLKD
jgi:hypothetical protein